MLLGGGRCPTSMSVNVTSRKEDSRMVGQLVSDAEAVLLSAPSPTKDFVVVMVEIPPFDGGLTCIVSTSVVHYKNATHTQK